MLRANCPSCGAALRFVSKASLYTVCAACGNLVLRKDLDVELVGALGQLQDDGTPIRLGTRGAFHDRKFEAVGRIQLQFPAGFWNEWHLLFAAGESGWLGEAAGTYVVTFHTKARGPLPAFERLSPGQSLDIDGEAFAVKTLDAATCVGGEGELPFRIESGYMAPVADLATHGRRFATIDYSETPPLLFVGEAVEFDELKLEGLRTLEGW
ncbi:MAG: DUF4178 domain-containing protein [Planctomycetes bacterium]|nr:DUF4178 domain-containing protein [Planctomycetota bacterium]